MKKYELVILFFIILIILIIIFFKKSRNFESIKPGIVNMDFNFSNLIDTQNTLMGFQDMKIDAVSFRGTNSNL